MATSLSRTGRTLLFVAVAAAAAAAGAWLAAGLERTPPEPPRIAGTYLEGGRPMADFNLLDHSGAPFTPKRFEDNWTLLNFGFTYCPDVCPQTLSALAMVVERMGERATGDIEVAFISVDPERDTTEQLAGYVSFFHPRFTGVTGEMGEIRKLTGSLGIAHQRRDYGDSYTIDHSAAILLINPEGKLQALFTPPHQPAAIAEDIAAIRHHWERQ